LASTAHADPVVGSRWAATYDNGGLGGSFAYLNSGGQSPFNPPFGGAWTIPLGPTDVVFRADFGAQQNDHYSNEASWDGSTYYYPFGFPDTTSYGERFFAPTGYVTSFDFLIYNTGGGGDGGCGFCESLGPVEATFVLARFDTDHLVGGPLFTRDVIVPTDPGFHWTNIGAFNVELQQGQEYIAFLTVADVHGAAPEPAAWTLMIGGFGGMGAMIRRRRAAAPA
jgi:hypothetical protein